MTHFRNFFHSLYRSLRGQQPSRSPLFMLSEREIDKITELSRPGFDRLNPEERKEFLSLGAKDFSQKFSGVVKALSHE